MTSKSRQIPQYKIQPQERLLAMSQQHKVRSQQDFLKTLLGKARGEILLKKEQLSRLKHQAFRVC